MKQLLTLELDLFGPVYSVYSLVIPHHCSIIY